MMRQYFLIFSKVLCVVLLLSGNIGYAQKEFYFKGKTTLEQLIEEKKGNEADLYLQTLINNFDRVKEVDSLPYFPYYIAKVERLNNSIPKAIQKMESFVNEMQSNNATEKSLYLAKFNMAYYFDEVSENQKSFEITKQALHHVLNAQDVTKDEIGKVKYNLGICYFSLDDIPNAKIKLQEAIVDYESYAQTSKQELSDGYNAMGAIMWLSTKLDSAKFFYSKAIEAIKLSKADSLENLYTATVIQSNISLLEYSQGNIDTALNIQNDVVKNYEKVILGVSRIDLRDKAQRYQARAISNLSTFYNEVGNLTKANELLHYVYSKQKLFLEPTDDSQASILIQIGQSELSLRSYEKSIKAIKKGLKIFEDKNAIRPYWKAAAYHSLANNYQYLGKLDSAAHYYNIAFPSFEKALGENIDKEYLSFLSDKSKFESSQGNHLAITTAQKAYDYVLDQDNEDEYALSKEILNLSTVYLNLKQYDKAEYWSAKGDSLLRKKATLAKTTIDSIKINYNRPLLLLIKVKSKFNKFNQPQTNDLSSLLKELQKAISILEQRKQTVFDSNDINQILSEYKLISDFSKQLNLELYKKTFKEEYLSVLMTTQESGIYNRIRTKLNQQQNIKFLGIPKHILEEEKNKKEALSSSLSTEESSIFSYYDKEEQWIDFLENLKRDYPEYYKMRYATIEIPIDQIIDNIPPDVTIVRYFFVGDELYAFVGNKNNQKLIAIDSTTHQELNDKISSVVLNQFNEHMLFDDLYKLYNDLWKPLLEEDLKQNIVIIPDGALYNLSFEMLTASRLSNYSGFATESLLAKHNISYNYSLLLVKNMIDNKPKNNFIAFTPEFSEEMKADYKIAISDSITIDKGYLKLLPQPFSTDVAESYNTIFSGDHFRNKQATKQLFMKQAGEHKIIHIGTHAESNNLSPELSRLIFAKPIEAESDIDDNSLYTYEIYNCNLTSNLAILTACETGKPGYQAGEGMISLAHAFNYAGSESILTSLWKIDEQSSAQIVGYFYEYLKDGLPKNEAIKKAKLQYLNDAEGRTLHPNYWAGLVLMGNTSSLELNEDWSWVWLLIIPTVIILGLVILKNRTRHS